jgi:hypothetical protein
MGEISSTEAPSRTTSEAHVPLHSIRTCLLPPQQRDASGTPSPLPHSCLTEMAALKLDRAPPLANPEVSQAGSFDALDPASP